MIYLLTLLTLSVGFVLQACPIEDRVSWTTERMFKRAALQYSNTPEIYESIAVSQGEVKSGWRGLVPLQSKRLDVERILGESIDSHGQTKVYQSKSERVDVLYSSGRCGDGQVWNVSADVVIRIVVTPDITILVQDLDHRGYVRVKESHPRNWVQYWSQDGGIMIQAIRNNSKEEVLNITYQPRKTDKALRCSSQTNRSN